MPLIGPPAMMPAVKWGGRASLPPLFGMRRLPALETGISATIPSLIFVPSRGVAVLRSLDVVMFGATEAERPTPEWPS